MNGRWDWLAALMFILGGLALAQAQEQEHPSAERSQHLTEAPLVTNSGAAFAVPSTYGRLVSVVASADVHYLYFEDAQGAVRVVVLGPRGASQRSRSALQLLSSDVWLLKRGSEADVVSEPAPTRRRSPQIENADDHR